VHAKAKGSADARTAVDLAFQPASAVFSGKAAGDVELEPVAMDVDLRIGDASETGKLEAPVLLVGPDIGGTLTVAGKNGVELLARESGTIEAVVHDAAGIAITGDAGMKLDVKLGGEAAAKALSLAWDPVRARFVAHADAAAKLAPGPVEIAINGAVAAQLPRLAICAEAKHGGRVIVAGDYSIEIVGKGNAAHAFVFDASGNAVTKADLDLSLRAGSGAFVKLAWDAPSLSYRADLGGKVDLAAEPLAVTLRADGKAFAGASLPSIAVGANANAALGADVDAKGHANGDLHAKGTIKPPHASAAVQVSTPKVEVHKSASASAGAGGTAGAKAGASFSFWAH